ncbi:WD40 repeat domain-containing protein [Nonomuraea sp. NPDC049152]|uniref:WD40 repeat domain-containing protein n=1 Tax=Nonomuraea sp. NPDC049152 TaxID=3154350 RepID=UPI0033F19220
MTIDDVVRETLGQWGDEARVPEGLADRALGRRRRNRIRTFAVIAGATAAVVAAAMTVPAALHGGGGETSVLLAGRGLTADGPAIVLPEPGELSADPDASPPTKLIATPEVAMYAYFVWDHEKISDKRQIVKQTWYLYNPATATYEKTPWAVVDVAPGGYVAVLEEQQARRVGVLSPDGQVKWVDLERPVSSVEWSPDGGRLLLSSYASNPNEQGVIDESGSSDVVPAPRTGFTVVDLADGQASFHPLASGDDIPWRNDLRWSDDGTLIWEQNSSESLTKRFYDLEGRPHEAPPKVAESHEEAGLSPSGRSLASDAPDKSAVVALADVATGSVTQLKPVAGHWIEQSVAWSGDDKVITWACELKGMDGCQGSEFRNRLLLVDADGGRAVPLTGFRENSQQPGSWEPLFARR